MTPCMGYWPEAKFRDIGRKIPKRQTGQEPFIKE